MKKLSIIVLAMLAGIISAFAANPTLYLRGDVNGWGATAKYKFTEADGVYTLKVDKLSGSFKIADSGWSSSANYGSNGQKIKIGTDYVMSLGGGNCALDGSGMAENVTLTFTLSTRTLKITGQAQANTYDKIYVIGDNGSGWEADRIDMPLEKVAGTNNQYKGTYRLNGATNYIKFKAGTWIYGPATSESADVDMTGGKSYTINYPCGDKAYKLSTGEYTFTITLDMDAATGTVKVEGEKSFPAKLYMLGDYRKGGTEYHWDPSQGVELASTAKGVYSVDRVHMVYGKDAAPAAYFSFCSQLGSGSGDWNVGARYGAAANDTPIALNDTKPIQAGEFSFAIAPGDYKLTVDLNAMTVKVDVATGVSSVDTEAGAAVSVYNMQGMQLRSGVAAANATEGLPAGLYIVGGRKVAVK